MMSNIFTIGDSIFFGVLFLIILFIALLVFFTTLDDNNRIRNGIISFVIGIIILGAIMLCTGLYNTNTASGQRALKDNQSNLENGIERTIKITAEDGRQIFFYEGKVDVESNHTDNYIKFESEDGKRYIIYYGIQDTIEIIEK